jgi:hypothetical protein
MKGIVYSILVILLLGPLILLSTTHFQSLRGYGKEIGSMIRVQEGYYFWDSLNDDLERSGEIIGRRAIIAATNYVIDEGTPLDSAPFRLKELIGNGTLYGESSVYMINTTLDEWVQRIENSGADRGFLIDFNISDFSITMGDSWNVLLTVDYSLSLKDQNNIFEFKRGFTKQSYISIINLEDPLFPLNTNGLISVRIWSSPSQNYTTLIGAGDGGNGWGAGFSIVVDDTSGITNRDEKILVISTAGASANDFAGVIAAGNSTVLTVPYLINSSLINQIQNDSRIVVDGSEGKIWDVSVLYNVWSNQYYVAGNGPSFFDRLEGSTTNSYPNKGIETFVSKQKISDKGIVVDPEESNVDHVYFDTVSPKIYKVKGMPDSFRIDDSTDNGETHIEIYEVEDLTY